MGTTIAQLIEGQMAAPERDPSRRPMPIPCDTGNLTSDTSRLGGGIQKLTNRPEGQDLHEFHEAVGRGWVIPPGGKRIDSLFKVSQTRLGIGRSDFENAPVWLELEDIVKLDALGDVVDGVQRVEMVMSDGTTITAGWTEDFCQLVVDALRASVVPGPTASEVVQAGEAGAGELANDAMSTPPSAEPKMPTATQMPPPAEPAPDPEVVDETYGAKPVVRRRSRRAKRDARTASIETPKDMEAPEFTSVPTAIPAADLAPEAAATSTTPKAPAIPDSPAGEDPSGAQTQSDRQPKPGGGANTKNASPKSSASTEQARSGEPTNGGAKPDQPRPSSERAAIGSLELEDVVYIGGHPEHSRRKKRCKTILTGSTAQVSGPSDFAIEMPWSSVDSIEVQNSDEARFRTNTKIHRDSSAIVLNCKDSTTVILEARDCPTVPLRAAITQLLQSQSVTVS